MKKLLMCLTVILSFIGINKVSAKELLLTDTTADSFTRYKEIMGVDNFNSIINSLVDKYKTDYSTYYPYFYINVDFSTDGTLESKDYLSVEFRLACEKELPEIYWTWAVSGSSVLTRFREPDVAHSYKYIIIENGNYVFDSTKFEDGRNDVGWMLTVFNFNSDGYNYDPHEFYVSNFDLNLPAIPEEERNLDVIKDYSSLGIPRLDATGYEIVSFTSDSFLIEPYYKYDNTSDYVPIDYEEINLNDYAYVALALKDYDQDTFTTTVQVKGSYCITPLYEFGLKSYDSITGTKVQNVCSPYYEDYTPVVTTITSDNLKNNSIYYIKAYDTSKENYIRVDTDIFDITLITEEDKDNPYVLVQGKYYPTIAYDNLPSSATQNTEEGYVPGASEKFDPIGTAADTLADMLKNPLEMLEKIFSSLILVFDLIFGLYALLPVEMQSFLMLTFMIAVLIGIIKMIC